MRADGKQKNRFAVQKTKSNSVLAVNTKTPNRFFPRRKFFDIKGGVKRVLRKHFLLFCRFLLNCLRQFDKKGFEFVGNNELNHYRKSYRISSRNDLILRNLPAL